jgi:hypothetical protein
MTRVWVDTNARLIAFDAAPPQIDTAPSGPIAPFDWQKAFAAAGLNPSAFSETVPSWTPPAIADERRAWKGTLPETDIPITIEAAAYRGRPVMFQLVMPWSAPAREPQKPGGGTNWIYISFLLGGAAITSYINVRRGRADRHGAFRVAAFMFFVVLGTWVAGPHIAGGAEEQQRFFARTGMALFVGGAMYILYLGLEPFVRRLWPEMLVGWTRVLSGRLRDPLIGRDMLVGIAAGAAVALVGLLPELVASWTGKPLPAPGVTDLGPLWGLRGTMIAMLQAINNGVQNTLINVFVYSLFRILFELVTRTPIGGSGWTIAAKLRMSERASDVVFASCVVIVTAITGYVGAPPSGAVRAAEVALFSLLLLVVLLRLGLLSVTVMFLTTSFLQRIPLTFDSSAIYVSATWLTLALLVGAALYGFRMATERRPARL